ncbi:MAG: 9-O-acetylesterase [Prevotellaceae bacterium]|jgi:sialate O-acetylesterase|nr:9-O-acetylesterase [Prevotellaceae bacterium]
MKRVFFFSCFVSLCLFSAYTEVKAALPALFSDNMVLQQQSDVPVWGTAKPNASVSVLPSWAEKPSTTLADAAGSWKVTIATPAAGGPHTLAIAAAGDTLTLRNVMLGEVWLCSGQSNMEMPLAGWGQVNNYEQEIANAQYPNIRLLQVERQANVQPQPDLKVQGGGWQVCSPATVAEFSATAYFFGRNLHQSLDSIPIGLINASWGGTVAEAWTSAESLESMPDFAEALAALKGKTNEELQEHYRKANEEWLRRFTLADGGMRDGKPLWADPELDDSRWDSMTLPALWENEGLDGIDGVVWFRCTINLPDGWEGKDLELSLAQIDDEDVTYFNGEQVGATGSYNRLRKYAVSGKLVKAGKNVVAVRVMDTGGGGGLYGEAANIYLKPAGSEEAQPVSLAQAWKYKLAVDMRNVPPKPQSPDNPNRPSVLYNAMLHPLVPFTIRGAIWYQGEANADRAQQYRELFPLLISDWRKHWGYEFPFYFVQLASFLGSPSEPTVSSWAALREAQLGTLRVPSTGMAVTIDVGEMRDIHPKNKQDVGARLALLARANTYGEQILCSGPLYSGYKLEGSRIRISFTHADGLKARDGGKLKGFTVAGADGKYYEAEAAVEGSEVVVWSPQVALPVEVRYAWADCPISANLCNAANLPASPFRAKK